MTFFQYSQILVIVMLNASGQLLFQKSASGTLSLATPAGIIGLLTNPVFILALSLYGLGTLLWIGVLQQVPLSRAYPFNALSFVIVPVAAIVFFGEAATPRLFVGMAMVVAGLLVIGGRG